jgi:hypothetical protein
MPRKVICRLALLMALMAAGCSDQRAVHIATEAADRQAEQNKEIAFQNRQIAETTKDLIAAEGQARDELIAMLGEIYKQRDALESERRAWSADRRRESLLAPVLENIGLVLACVVVVGYCAYLIRGLRDEQTSEPAVNELLVQYLASDQPVPPLPVPVDAVEQLPMPVIVKQ